MAEFDDDRKVVMIKGRMRRLGLDLDRYIGQITNTWPRPGTPQVPPWVRFHMQGQNCLSRSDASPGG
jgi:hypothetical protein